MSSASTVEQSRRVLKQRTRRVDQIGSEVVTFSRLGERVGSADASTCRYFESGQRRVVYLTRAVDDATRDGCFRCSIRIGRRVADVTLEPNPAYVVSVALVSKAVRNSHVQKHVAEQLPSLTEVSHVERDGSTMALRANLVVRVIGVA